MKKWEYCSYTINVKTLSLFDELGGTEPIGNANTIGKEGWELVSINAESPNFFLAVAIFKREAVPDYKKERVWLFVDTTKIGAQEGYLRYVDDWRGVAVQFARTLDVHVKVLDIDGGLVETVTKDDVPF